jgi:hypothetical protein
VSGEPMFKESWLRHKSLHDAPAKLVIFQQKYQARAIIAGRRPNMDVVSKLLPHQSDAPLRKVGCSPAYPLRLISTARYGEPTACLSD